MLHKNRIVDSKSTATTRVLSGNQVTIFKINSSLTNSAKINDRECYNIYLATPSNNSLSSPNFSEESLESYQDQTESCCNCLIL